MIPNTKPPFFLRAKTPEDLRKLMLLNNRRHSRKFHYFDFQFVKGSWYCWFEIDETERLDGNGNIEQ